MVRFFCVSGDCFSSVASGFASLLGQLLDEDKDKDKSLVAEHTAYWLQVISNGDSTGDQVCHLYLPSQLFV